MEDPLPQVELWCNNAFLGERWKEFYANGTIHEFATNAAEGQIYPCDLLRYKKGDEGNYYYTALMWFEDQKTGVTEPVGKLNDVPRQAFKYFDRPYTSDTFLPNAFRHHIGIPDDMFPEAWRNDKPVYLGLKSHSLNIKSKS